MNQIEQIKQLLDTIPSSHTSNIGIGINTHNRPDMLAKCYEHVTKYAPSGAKIVVVDDASTKPSPLATYRFIHNVGIARAKNKTLELLYLAGCEHIFLLDDDTYPLTPDAWAPYINSKEPHLNYIFTNYKGGKSVNDMIELYRDNEIVAYSHVRGCMLYYHRSVLDKVGGMDEVFGKWGYEHPSHSDRIFMAGLTSFRYMDVVNSVGLWYSDDEHNQNVNTTVKLQERQQCLNRNKPLYEERKFTSTYIPFIEKRNILLTCYFTNVKDPQRGNEFKADLGQLNPLINSLNGTELVILHDCFENPPTIPFVIFQRVSTSINPYFQRWISYREYLMRRKDEIDHVFCIDATDVELLRTPEWDNIGNNLITGDELCLLDDAGGWMRKNHMHDQIQVLLNTIGKKQQMLNAGICGGKVDTVIEFMRALIDFYCMAENDKAFHKKEGAGLTDMGAFNYIARTVFRDRMRYGRDICTEFKKNERNDYSWFKHK